MSTLGYTRSQEGLDHVTCRLCGRAYRAITYSHLVRRHRFDPEHPIESYKTRFRLKYAECQETVKKRNRIVNQYLERTGRRWTQSRVNKTIRDLVRRGHPLNHSAANRYGSLVPEGIRWYGSWERALEANCISYEKIRLRRKNWTREMIVESVKADSRAGRDLSQSAVARRDSGRIDAARNLFGCWDNTLVAAGENPDEIRRHRRWSPERVLGEIRERAKTTPLNKIMNYEALALAAYSYFGSRLTAIKAAGFDYRPRTGARRWPREKIVELFRRRKKKGLPISYKIMKKFYNGCVAAGYREFGNWAGILSAVRRRGRG